MSCKLTYLLGGFTHEHEALSVRNDFAGVQGLLEIFDELILVAAEGFASGAAQDLGGARAFILDRRQASSKDGLANEGDCSKSDNYRTDRI